jgi:predicted porin
MREKHSLQRTLLAAAIAAALGSTAIPAKADVIEDLKVEIAAQRAQIEAQRLRLEAMERKLDTAAAQAASSQVTAKAASEQAALAQVAAAQKAPESKSFIQTLVASADWEPGFKFQVTPVDTVTLYGLIDATISDISNANAKGDHKRSTQTPWLSGDRWGITGRHGIGDDKTALIFKLESEFDFQTGEEDTPGVLFNRDAWVGFQSEALGKITFGRQNALARDYTSIYGDPYGSARVTLEEGGYTNVNNFKQLIFYAASATGTRIDRGIVWKKEWGPLVSGVAYQFGGVPGQFQTGSTQTYSLGWNQPGDFFHLAGFYNHFDVVGLDTKAWSFGGNVQLGPIARLNAGYYKYNSEQGGNVGNRRDHAWTTSVKVTPPGPWEYDLGYQVLHAQNAGVNSAGNVLTPYADASGVKATGTGDKKTLYGSVFYHFDRRAEVYLVSDYMKLSEGYHLAITNGHDKQVEVGVGVRLRF